MPKKMKIFLNAKKAKKSPKKIKIEIYKPNDAFCEDLQKLF